MRPLKYSSDTSLEYEELIEEIRPRLCAFVLSLTGSRNSADDLVQETCLLLWEKKEEYRPGGNFRAWAFQIAFFQVQNHRRKMARQRNREIPGEKLFERIADSASQLHEIDDADVRRKKALLHCLGKLKEEHRELILNRYQDGRKLKLLASSEGITSNAMAQKLFRIKRSLLGCVEKQLPKSR